MFQTVAHQSRRRKTFKYDQMLPLLLYFPSCIRLLVSCWTLNNMCAYFRSLPWRETLVLALSNDQAVKAARQAVPELGITFPLNLSRWIPSSKCAHEENRETFFSRNIHMKQDVCSQAYSCKNSCQGCSLTGPRKKHSASGFHLNTEFHVKIKK